MSYTRRDESYNCLCEAVPLTDHPRLMQEGIRMATDITAMVPTVNGDDAVIALILEGVSEPASH